MIYQIKISLIDSTPEIWRRLLISSELYLPDLHKIIQSSFGWTNSHLHQFIKDNIFYSEPLEEDFDLEDVDYSNIKVSDLLKHENDKILYEYDFGESWEHDIILEKIHAGDKKTHLPVCTDGEMNCPPEDCGGGALKYAEILEILNQPDHSEYEEYLEWIGEDFDPEYFDKDEINEVLKTENYGLI